MYENIVHDTRNIRSIKFGCVICCQSPLIYCTYIVLFNDDIIFLFMYLISFFVVDMDPKSMTVMSTGIIPHTDQIDIGLGSMEKGNTVLTAKPRKKTMTSVYLKYFETALDGKSRRCKFCGQSYSIATATGYFLNCFSPLYFVLVLAFRFE